MTRLPRLPAQAWVLPAIAAMLAATACRSTGSVQVKNVCSAPLPHLVSAGNAIPISSLTPDFWASLLLRGFDRDCSGERFGNRPSGRCSAHGPDSHGDAVGHLSLARLAASSAKQMPLELAGPLNRDRIIVRSVGNTGLLVWLRTHRDPTSNDDIGPIAFVRFARGKAQVLAIGTLRASGRIADLRFERLGKARVLVAETERCPDATRPTAETRAARADDARPCDRDMYLLVQENQRFTAAPLAVETEGCAGNARLELVRHLVRPTQQRGIEQRVELSTRVDFSGEVATLLEKVVIREEAVDDPSHPARLLRSAQGTRSLRLDAKGWSVDRRSLLELLDTEGQPGDGEQS